MDRRRAAAGLVRERRALEADDQHAQRAAAPGLGRERAVDARPAGIFGTTLEPLNKSPVTDTVLDVAAVFDCRSSVDGGSHRTSNFRSSHAGGAHFLYADGGVRFVAESIAMPVYRAASTIAGAELLSATE